MYTEVTERVNWLGGIIEKKLFTWHICSHHLNDWSAENFAAYKIAYEDLAFQLSYKGVKEQSECALVVLMIACKTIRLSNRSAVNSALLRGVDVNQFIWYERVSNGFDLSMNSHIDSRPENFGPGKVDDSRQCLLTYRYRTKQSMNTHASMMTNSSLEHVFQSRLFGSSKKNH